MQYIDLHVHSTASDGSLTPSELVDYAIQKELCAFALTDHDTVDGIAEAMAYAQQLNAYATDNPTATDYNNNHNSNTANNNKNSIHTDSTNYYDNNDSTSHTNTEPVITVIPGIELSAEYNRQDIHILGLNIDYKNKQFLDEIEIFRNSRSNRNEKMILKLQEQGFDITPELVSGRFGDDTVITRAHYAILMVEGGYVKDKNEAFEKYLNPDCPCYVPRTKVSVTDAVRLILLANGKPVIAHPVLYHLSEDELDTLVALLKDAGLMGIEAIYSMNTEADEIRLRALAKKYDLFITGGSDFHGTAKPNLALGTGYGNLRIPKELLVNILE